MNAGTMKRTGAVLAGVAGAGALVAGGFATASATPRASKSKPLTVVGVRTVGEKFGSVQFAGVIGDFGKTEYVDASGHSTTSGNSYLKATLQDGTVTIKVAKLQSKLNNPKVFNSTTCSGEFKATAAVPIIGGSGGYAGIHGSLTVTLVSDFVLPRVASGAEKGQCNGNGLPRHAMSTYSGTGTASV
jgi:hypothetical protein